MAKEDKNTAIYIAYDDVEPLDPSSPEKNLLKAVILSAVSDLKRSGSANRRAIEYLLSPEEDYLFSFRSICNFLEVDADRILVLVGLRKSILAPKHPETLEELLSEVEAPKH